jgi:hypothetical protein
MTLPARGLLTSFSLADGVGRIRLEDGSELKVGASALQGMAPVVGLPVLVEAVAPHPLGGRRATRIRSVDSPTAAAARGRAFETTLDQALRADAERSAQVADTLASVTSAPQTQAEAEELARQSAEIAAARQAQRAEEERTVARVRKARIARGSTTVNAAWTATPATTACPGFPCALQDLQPHLSRGPR